MIEKKCLDKSFELHDIKRFLRVFCFVQLFKLVFATRTWVRDNNVLVIAYRALTEFAVTIFLAVRFCAFLTSEFFDKTLMNVMFIISAVKTLPKLAIAYISLRKMWTFRKVKRPHHDIICQFRWNEFDDDRWVFFIEARFFFESSRVNHVLRIVKI